MPERIIAIGDIHGCHREFGSLLDILSPEPGDRIILLGDLINRGPDSAAVMDLAIRHRATALVGNHERRLLAYWRTRDISLLKKEDLPTLEALRPPHWAFLQSMVLTYHVPEYDLVFVHGGFLPGINWSDQPAEVVTRIQAVDAQGRPRKRSDCEGCPLWTDLWKGPPFVVYGHTPRKEIHETRWALGLDTGCVYGGHLTACILPEKKFVQVRALRSYHP